MFKFKILIILVAFISGIFSHQLENRDVNIDVHINDELNDENYFVKIGAKKYLIEPNHKASWFDAAHACRKYNAQLASLETSKDMEALTEYLIHNGLSTTFYISLNDLGKENRFVWLGSGNGIGYSKWATGEPDKKVVKNCVYISMQNESYYWKMWDCKGTAGYICEKDL